MSTTGVKTAKKNKLTPSQERHMRKRMGEDASRGYIGHYWNDRGELMVITRFVRNHYSLWVVGKRGSREFVRAMSERVFAEDYAGTLERLA